MKIAITTSDGKQVDTHFGKAKVFHIFEIKQGKINLLEKRSTTAYCSSVEGHPFREDKFEAVYEVLKDCQILFTKKIGDVPAEKLREKGLEVFENNGPIVECVN